MGRDTIQLENAISAISQEYLLEFTSEYGIPEGLHPKLLGPDRGFSGGQSRFLGGLENISHHRGPAHKRSKGWDASSELLFRGGRNSIGHTPYPIKKQPEALLCLVGLSQRYFSLTMTGVDMDLFNLISAPNPTNVKTKTRLRAAHELALLTITVKDQVQDKVAYEIPPTGNASTTGVTLEEEVAAMGPLVNKRRRERGNNETEANALPKVLRRDHDAFRPVAGLHPYPKQDIAQSSKGTATKIPTEDVSTAEVNVQFSVRSLESGRLTFVPSVVGSPGGIYQPRWGVTNDCHLDTPDACQDVVDHIVPPGYFSELRHLPNADFLSQYNINLARKVAMGSQLRLRFEQEVRLLKKARSKIARRDQRIQVREEEIKKLDRKKKKNFNPSRLWNQNRLSEKVLNLQARVIGEEKIKASFEEFKKYEDDKVEQRCAEMNARLDKLSVDFDEELYPHILTAIAGRRWDLPKAYDPEANSKLVKSLQDLKDLKYLMVDQLERLKDALMELLMILVYPEVRYHEDPWAAKEEDGSAHHAKSDSIPVFAPTVPQGLEILLADVATQTEAADKEEEPHPRLQ
ncbi:hypothetical protein Tco_1177011 [Tanacetum coccineum]